MKDTKLRSIAIVGGGTAGWMSAAILSRLLHGQNLNICLIDNNEGNEGLDIFESSLPSLQSFHRFLGIKEREFLQYTQGSFKLGTQFRGWSGEGKQYFHCFGDFGDDIEGLSPYHYWLKLNRLGETAPLSDYSLYSVTAQLGNFSFLPRHSEALSNHAYHFDATLYAEFLSKFAQGRGIRRIQGKVVDVKLDKANGFIEALQLKSGQAIRADFYIDCSGFRALLIEQALQTGYVSWAHWLPTDKAVTVTSENEQNLFPAHTSAEVLPFGWQRRVPLQRHTGSGYIYNSYCISDDQAAESLLASLPGKAVTSPRISSFTAGHRKKVWNKNCLAIGNAAGFLEPLEHSSTHFMLSSLQRFVNLFPDKRFDPIITDEYNRKTLAELSRVRDLIILHYATCATKGSQLWHYCKHMKLPSELERKLRVFSHCGYVPLLTEEVFNELSWISVLTGQNILPKRPAPIVEGIDSEALRNTMLQRRTAIRQTASNQPSHAAFVQQYCAG